MPENKNMDILSKLGAFSDDEAFEVEDNEGDIDSHPLFNKTFGELSDDEKSQLKQQDPTAYAKESVGYRKKRIKERKSVLDDFELSLASGVLGGGSSIVNLGVQGLKHLGNALVTDANFDTSKGWLPATEDYMDYFEVDRSSAINRYGATTGDFIGSSLTFGKVFGALGSSFKGAGKLNNALQVFQKPFGALGAILRHSNRFNKTASFINKVASHSSLAKVAGTSAIDAGIWQGIDEWTGLPDWAKVPTFFAAMLGRGALSRKISGAFRFFRGGEASSSGSFLGSAVKSMDDKANNLYETFKTTPVHKNKFTPSNTVINNIAEIQKGFRNMETSNALSKNVIDPAEKLFSNILDTQARQPLSAHITSFKNAQGNIYSPKAKLLPAELQQAKAIFKAINDNVVRRSISDVGTEHLSTYDRAQSLYKFVKDYEGFQEKFASTVAKQSTPNYFAHTLLHYLLYSTLGHGAAILGHVGLAGASAGRRRASAFFSSGLASQITKLLRESPEFRETTFKLFGDVATDAIPKLISARTKKAEKIYKRRYGLTLEELGAEPEGR